MTSGSDEPRDTADANARATLETLIDRLCSLLGDAVGGRAKITVSLSSWDGDEINIDPARLKRLAAAIEAAYCGEDAQKQPESERSAIGIAAVPLSVYPVVSAFGFLPTSADR